MLGIHRWTAVRQGRADNLTPRGLLILLMSIVAAVEDNEMVPGTISGLRLAPSGRPDAPAFVTRRVRLLTKLSGLAAI